MMCTFHVQHIVLHRNSQLSYIICALNSFCWYISHLSPASFPMQGHPFMESLTENKALLYSLLTSGAAIVCLTCGILPDVSRQFELEELTPEVLSDFRNTSSSHVLFSIQVSHPKLFCFL